MTEPKRCAYKHGNYLCRHAALPDRDLCIFHLPVDQKDTAEFWKHLASYLLALYNADPVDTTQKFLAQASPWISREYDGGLLNHFRVVTKAGAVWDLRGFVFPGMDDTHSFRGFVFARPIDFSGARFRGDSAFADAVFHGPVDFVQARFRGRADFARAKFLGPIANFGGGVFLGHAEFTQAHFGNKAWLTSVRFGSKSSFWHAVFEGETSFRAARFRGNTNFRSVEYKKTVDFGRCRFRSQADFSGAKFAAQVDFQDSLFGGDASFMDAEFNSRALFFTAHVNKDLDFSFAKVKHRLHFGGADIGPDATVRLWGLSFGRGEVGESYGEVVFRDMPEQSEGGMARVSFLHTVIYGDRPRVRFENVHWQTNPSKFLHDAKYVIPHRWHRVPRELPSGWRERLYQLFNVPRRLGPGPEPAPRTPEDEANLRKLIRLDVERAAREIRRYYEDYGSYPDAGEYHIAEMEYRQRVTAKSKWFVKGLLWLYGRLSRYGEAPGRAALALLILTVGSAFVYLFSGFEFLGQPRQRVPFAPGPFLQTLGDYGLALVYALANIVPGWFRPQSMNPACCRTLVISAFQTLLGVSVLALFLLALRRRFRR